MPAFSKSRLMIAAAFAAGVATTAAFVTIGFGETTASQGRTALDSSAPVTNAGGEPGSGSWVDPTQPIMSKHVSHVASPDLVFRPDTPAEEYGASTGQIKRSASALTVPAPPRRPESLRVAAHSIDQNAQASLGDHPVRKVVVPKQADGINRKQKAAPTGVQRYAGAKEDAVGSEIRERKQRVTSTEPNGVMQWLIEPSRF